MNICIYIYTYVYFYTRKHYIYLCTVIDCMRMYMRMYDNSRCYDHVTAITVTITVIVPTHATARADLVYAVRDHT